MELLIEQIIVDEARQRSTLPNIPELAASINNLGLINPITVTPENVLITGERRLNACKSLGWMAIPVTVMEPEDDLKRHVIELEENIKREPLDWRDYVRAVGQYKDQTEKTFAEMSDDLAISSSTLSRLVLVYNHLEDVVTEDNYTTAYNLIARKLERKRAAAEIELPEIVAHDAPRKSVPSPVTGSDTQIPIIHTDFLTWLPTYNGPGFNLFHCDFPYGIKTGTGSGLAATRHAEYADTPDVYFDLLHAFCQATHIRQPSAHLIFWFSMNYYHQTKEALEAAGWWVEPYPLIWMREAGKGIIPDSARTFRRLYETAFFASFGDRKILRSRANIHLAPLTNTYHPSQKPWLMLDNLFDALIDETTSLLDPTCGSGIAVITAKKHGATVLGLERDETFHAQAVEHWKGKMQ